MQTRRKSTWYIDFSGICSFWIRGQLFFQWSALRFTDEMFCIDVDIALLSSLTWLSKLFATFASCSHLLCNMSRYVQDNSWSEAKTCKYALKAQSEIQCWQFRFFGILLQLSVQRSLMYWKTILGNWPGVLTEVKNQSWIIHPVSPLSYTCMATAMFKV